MNYTALHKELITVLLLFKMSCHFHSCHWCI